MTAVTRTVSPYRFFTVRVARITDLSPSFLRVTFTGSDLDRFADNGADQRIKLVVPLAESGLRYLPTDSDTWYVEWQQLPDGQRNPLRTYTVRAVRPESYEVEVDVVRHRGGVAAQFIDAAAVGTEAVLLGPNADYDGDHGGVEWHPPVPLGRYLLAGDETAVPAIARICGDLPSDAEGRVMLEVPEAADFFDFDAPPGISVTWLARGSDPHGSRLFDEVVAVAGEVVAGEAGAVETLEEVDADLPWEVPDATDAGPYAWIAGEDGWHNFG